MSSIDSRNDLRTPITKVIGFSFLMLIMVLALAVSGCGGDNGGGTSKPESTQATPAASSSAEGKSTFTSTCGGCHTLADAGTKGSAGPNFDDLKPDKARVQAAIKNGGTGSGAMPKNLLSGEKAEQVADYVSSAAGK